MRKSSFRFIIAALAATVALAACTKEPAPGKADTESKAPVAEGSRTIAVSFAAQPQTKTYLDKDGLQPKFNDGDSILISNGEVADTCRVSVDDKTGAATISTDLTGPLTAAYPAKFGKVKKGKIEYVEVSSVQSGKFSDANICWAEMEGENESSLHFQNIWPILKFYVDKSIGVKSIEINSHGESITDDDNPNTIFVAAPEGKTLYDVMPSEGQDKRICYVALSSSEVNSRNLSFEIKTISQGTVTKTPTKNVSLERGYMYNVFIPYYIEVDGLKWGYCNVGAFLPEDPGEYFSWGNTQGYVYNGTNWLSASDGATLAGGFCTANYEGTNGAGISGRDLGVNTTDDAAYANWDKGWRLPTQEELNILRDNLSAMSGGCGCDSLFLPAAGAGFENGIAASDTCFYWSSTISTDIENQACVLCFPFNEGHFYSVVRYCGLPIRPIYSPAPEGTLYGKFTISETGTQVYFSKGNLYYENSVPKFEANQYDYRIYCGKEDDQAVIGGVLTTTPSGNVGSFFWCDNAAAACAATYEDETPATEFFAEELDVNGTTYHSLTKAEWEYLLGNNTKRNGLHKTDVTIKIDGGKTVVGLVIAPDGFNASNFKSEYTKAEWAEAESAYNLVFLPAAGWSDDERTVQSEPGNFGNYWLKDYIIDVDEHQWVSYLEFASSYAEAYQGDPNCGYSVRLVKKILRRRRR